MYELKSDNKYHCKNKFPELTPIDQFIIEDLHEVIGCRDGMGGFIYSKIAGWKFESEISFLIQIIDRLNHEKREKEKPTKNK